MSSRQLSADAVRRQGGALRTGSSAVDDLQVPYVPTPLPIVEKMLELARVRSSDVVYDMGSGDGRTVIMAARKFGAQAIGVELNTERFQASAARVARLGLGSRVRILHSSMFDTDLHEATVVTLYLLSKANEQLRPKFERELRRGTRVVAHDFPIPGWKPERVIGGRQGGDSLHTLYLYVVGEQKEEMMPVSQEHRSYSAGRFALELDGQMAGWLHSAEGGNASAAVVEEKLGPDHIVHKHLAGVKYEDITVNCGTTMSKQFYDWLTATLSYKFTRKNGAVIYADYDGNEIWRLAFYDALVSEIGFPALDASSKDPAKMTIKISPEYTRREKGGGTLKAWGATKGQKPWLQSNFRLMIDDVDCTHVSKIEGLPIGVYLVVGEIGELRDYQQEPSHLQMPNLVVTVSESHARDFMDWFDDFVIQGNSSSDKEKNGTLEFLSPNLQDVLFTLMFKHIGIFKLYPEHAEPDREAIARLRAEMYVEQIEFSPPAGAAAGASTGLESGASPFPGRGYSTHKVAEPDTAAKIAQAEEFKVFKQALFKELLDEVSTGLKQAPPVEQVARLGPPLRFRN